MLHLFLPPCMRWDLFYHILRHLKGEIWHKWSFLFVEYVLQGFACNCFRALRHHVVIGHDAKMNGRCWAWCASLSATELVKPRGQLLHTAAVDYIEGSCLIDLLFLQYEVNVLFWALGHVTAMDWLTLSIDARLFVSTYRLLFELLTNLLTLT